MSPRTPTLPSTEPALWRKIFPVNGKPQVRNENYLEMFGMVRYVSEYPAKPTMQAVARTAPPEVDA